MDSPAGAILSRMAASLPNAKVGAIIVAAGESARMGAAGDKTLADLAGEPLIARTVDAFERCGAVSCVALVVSERNLDAVAAIREAKGWSKTLPPVLGGARRQDSVRAGLEALPEDCGWIVVHDGVRPFVSPALIEAGIEAAHPTGAAVAVVPAFDTVKRVGPDGGVLETLDRAELQMAQTPQVFRRDVLERAHAEITDDATDDAAMAERVGVEVRTFAGDRGNIKITTAEDLGVVGGNAPSNAALPISAVAIISIAFDQILEGLIAIEEWSPTIDLDTVRKLAARRSYGCLKSAMLVLEAAYYEQGLALLRIGTETMLTIHAAEQNKTIVEAVLKSDHKKLSFREMSRLLHNVEGINIEETWVAHYRRLSQYVHPSGLCVPLQLSTKDDVAADALCLLVGLVIELMGLIAILTHEARVGWRAGAEPSLKALVNLHERLDEWMNARMHQVEGNS